MKLLLDFFPIVLSFAAYKLWAIYLSTGVAIVATIEPMAYLPYSFGNDHFASVLIDGKPFRSRQVLR